MSLWIVTAEPAKTTVTGEKSPDGYSPIYGDEPNTTPETQRHRTPVKTEGLKRQMREFVGSVEEIFDEAEHNNTKIQLDEIELTVEVNAEGEVSLWGLGGTSVGGSAAMTLKFSRKGA